MSILINDGSNEVGSTIRCDIGEFVMLVEKLKENIKPFQKLFGAIQSLFRWERPLMTICIMVVSSYIMRCYPVFILSFTVLPLPPMMLFGLMRVLRQRKKPTKKYLDFFERKDEEYTQQLKLAIQHEKQRHLNMYLDTVIAMNRIFNDVNKSFQNLDEIFNWKDKKTSLKVMVLQLSFLISMHLFDIGTVMCVVNLMFYLWNKHLYQEIKTIPVRTRLFISSNKKPSTSKAIQRNSEQDVSAENDTTMNTNELYSEFSSTESEEDELDSKIKGNHDVTNQPMDNSGSVMSKLIPSKWRRRYISAGNCSKCDQPASSILKKRRYCRHCGQSFCAKCCNIRVPRSLLGATAPAAYQEKVLVCLTCHVFLTNRLNPHTEIVE